MNFTIYEIITATGVLAGFVSSLILIRQTIRKLLLRLFDEHLTEIAKHIDKIEMTSAKSFIVMALSRLERDGELSPMERQRFWEAVSEYHRQGGNGYIDAQISLFKEQRKL